MNENDRRRLYNYVHEGNIDFHDLRDEKEEVKERWIGSDDD